MKKLALALVPIVALLTAGCLGSSSANAPGSSASSQQPPSTVGISSGVHTPALDAATRRRLLVEYHASRISQCPPGTQCQGVPLGVFWTGQGLVNDLHHLNPAIPVTTNLNATMSLDTRFVFVLSDSTRERLDIATAAADGRYVHLIAVGTHAPEFKFGGL